MIEQLLSVIILSILWIESFHGIEEGYQKYMNLFYLTFMKQLLTKTFIIASMILMIFIFFGPNEYIQYFSESSANILTTIFHKSICYMFMIETVNLLTKH